jgi:hypothetical protein
MLIHRLTCSAMRALSLSTAAGSIDWAVKSRCRTTDLLVQLLPSGKALIESDLYDRNGICNGNALIVTYDSRLTLDRRGTRRCQNADLQVRLGISLGGSRYVIPSTWHHLAKWPFVKGREDGRVDTKKRTYLIDLILSLR